MASRVPLSLPNPDAADPERPPPALPSDLLEEIFLRLASPADLARASAACVSFRRIIADHAFLRRYRSIHPPLLLGFVNFLGLQPVEAPHPSAAVARAVSFCFDYLPFANKYPRWDPCDVRGGRVLLRRACRIRRGPRKGYYSWGFLVCDPLSRQYLLLPSITDGLLAPIGIQYKDILHSDAAFIGSEGGVEEEISFTVINWLVSSSRFYLDAGLDLSPGQWFNQCQAACLGVVGLGDDDAEAFSVTLVLVLPRYSVLY